MSSVTFDILARDRASQAFKNVGKETDNLHNKLGRVAKRAALAAGAAGLGAFTAAIKTGIGEVNDYQKGFAQLEQGLKTTHGAAGITAKQMEALASRIQDYSGQTDDSIVATEQLLLTFTNIRNEAGKGNQIFTQTTKIAADMAARLGGDASSAAIQLGKALNDPIKGVTALSRVGVSFDDAQKKQIKTLIKHGHTMAAQKIILHELNKEFGGSAKAVGDTLPGQIEKAKRGWEDLSQRLVTALLPAFNKLVSTITTQILPALNGMLTFVQKNATWLKPLAAVVGSLAAVIWTVVKVTKIWTAVQAALDVVLNANPIGAIIIGVAALAAGIIYAYKHSDRFRAIVQRAFAVVQGAVKTLVGIWTAELHAAVAVIQGTVHAVSSSTRAIIGFFKAIPDRVKGFFESAGQWLLNAGKDVIRGFINGLKSMAGDIITAIKNTITDPLPGFVKKALGIASPSKVFHAIGLNVMEGLVSGLGKGHAALKATLQNLIASFKETASSIAGSLLGYGDISGAADAGVGIPAFLRAKANDMQRFARLFHRLAARGLSPALLAQFAAIGPPAIGSMQELLGARGAIGSANAQERRLERFTNQVGRDVASVQLAHSVDRLPKAIARELAKELRHTPINVHVDGAGNTVHRLRRGN